MTNNILFSIFKQRAYVYIRNAGWLCRISCSVLAVPPADDPFFHVAFYPYHRLTVHCYKWFISGPPADSSLRVKTKLFLGANDVRLSLFVHISVCPSLCPSLSVLSLAFVDSVIQSRLVKRLGAADTNKSPYRMVRSHCAQTGGLADRDLPV